MGHRPLVAGYGLFAATHAEIATAFAEAGLNTRVRPALSPS